MSDIDTYLASLPQDMKVSDISAKMLFGAGGSSLEAAMPVAQAPERKRSWGGKPVDNYARPASTTAQIMGDDVDDKYLNEYVRNTLKNHMDKNFVQRFVNDPYGTNEKYPKLYSEDQYGNKRVHSLEMASGYIGDTPAIYPTIVQFKGEDKLTRLPVDDAARYAEESGEYIPFSSDNEAQWFGYNNYKRGTQFYSPSNAAPTNVLIGKKR